MREIYVNIGKRIRRAREHAGMSQQQVADQIGLSDVGYGAFERGTRQISLEYLFALSRVLHRSVPWFLGLDSDLSEEEDRLLSLYRSAPPGAKEMVLATVEAMVTTAKQ
jgi:transcriptional regulator with XRE-family HTH domain